MPFVIDIGNSAVKWAQIRDGRATTAGRIKVRHPDETGSWLPELVRAATDHGDSSLEAVIVSVVPAMGRLVEAEFLHRFGTRPLVVSSALKLPFAMGYESPATLGADRIAAAAGALDRVISSGDPSRAVLVIDAGTALTIDLVDRDRVFQGGVIAPGPALLAAALRRGTAQLPEVTLDLPPDVVGRSTDEAIRSGVMHGFVAATDGLVARMAMRSGAEPYVVATGGWARLLAAEIPRIRDVVPDLVLTGAASLADINRAPSGKASGS